MTVCQLECGFLNTAMATIIAATPTPASSEMLREMFAISIAIKTPVPLAIATPNFTEQFKYRPANTRARRGRAPTEVQGKRPSFSNAAFRLMRVSKR